MKVIVDLLAEILQKPLHAAHVALGFALALAPDISFAGQSLPDSVQVKEEETQLAQRFSVRESVEASFEYSLGAGYRVDNLNWSIANAGVNIASELSWKKTVIAQIRAAAKLNFGGDWLLRGVYTTGAVKSGTNQDSDYAGSGRIQEYSRSDSQTGGAVRDLSIGLGRKFRLSDAAGEGEGYVAPLAGYSVHQQDLTMHDGQQTVPFSTTLTRLNNNYDAQWNGAWVGMDALFGMGWNVSLNATVEYHWIDYSAEANWNLRNDLAHPLSFTHTAKGRGVLVSVGLSYRLSRNLLLNTSFDQQRWNTDAGYDHTFFSYGASSYYTLNAVNWDSRAVSLGAVYQF